jgi:hypothetical protein
MFKNWFQKDKSAPSPSGKVAWTAEATQALDEAVAQAPVPQLLKNRLKKELKKTAEDHAQKNNRTTVTPQDLLEGLMTRLPAHMQQKVKDMMEKGSVNPNELLS